MIEVGKYNHENTNADFDSDLVVEGVVLELQSLSVSDSKNGARLEWWVKSLYNDLYHYVNHIYTKNIFKFPYFSAKPVLTSH